MRTSGNNAKLSSDICDRILGVASKSVSLQEIHVPSIGARWEFAARLSQVKRHAILISCDTDKKVGYIKTLSELYNPVQVDSF